MTRYYKDSAAISLPLSKASSLKSDVGRALIIDNLNRAARLVLQVRYPQASMLDADWTFAFTEKEIDDWVLPHDCDDCRECKTLGIAKLREGKDFICLGTIHCVEPSEEEV